MQRVLPTSAGVQRARLPIRAGMSAWPFLALFALAAPWWWPLWQALRADLLSGAVDPPSPRRAPRRLGPAPILGGPVPPHRLLAFQGVPERLRARRRWEGGFGRRSP